MDHISLPFTSPSAVYFELLAIQCLWVGNKHLVLAPARHQSAPCIERHKKKVGVTNPLTESETASVSEHPLLIPLRCLFGFALGRFWRVQLILSWGRTLGYDSWWYSPQTLLGGGGRADTGVAIPFHSVLVQRPCFQLDIHVSSCT